MPNEFPEINYKILGERIRSIRISKGFTSHESFANKYEISRSQYARYEKGMNLRFASLVKLIAAFDMTLKEFFGDGFDDIQLK